MTTARQKHKLRLRAVIEKMGCLAYGVSRWSLLAYAFVVIGLSLVAFFNSSYGQFRGIQAQLVIVGIVTLCGLVLLFALRPGRSSRRASILEWRGKYVLYGACVALLVVVHAHIAVSMMGDYYMTAWDAGMVFNTSVLLVDPHVSSLADFSSSYARHYFTILPNNLGVLSILTLWLGLMIYIFGAIDFPTAAVIFNTLLMDAGIIAAVVAARLISGRRAMLVSVFFFVILVVLSPWSRTFYSDTVGFCWIGVSLLIGVLLVRARTYGATLALLNVGALLLGTGYSIKPTVAILGLSGALCAIFYGMFFKMPFVGDRFGKLQLATLTVIPAIVAFSSLALLPRFAIHRLDIHPQQIPSSHFMMIGLSKSCQANNQLCEWGAYSDGDWENYTTHYGSPELHEEYARYTHHEIIRRISAMGFLNYVIFLIQKGAWIMGDGTFFAYGESNEYSNSPALVGIAPYLPVPKGQYYYAYVLIMQGVWYTCLILGVCWALYVAHLMRSGVVREHVITIWIFASLIGLMLFLLIFEARSRYVFLYLPLFVVVASMGATNFGRLVHICRMWLRSRFKGR